ncbi:MAG: hypothetical protein WBL93_12795 [Lutisporaceae bacterium]
MICGTYMSKGNNRINKTLNNKKFKEYIDKNAQCEKKRKFCKHDSQHLIDVARIAYIVNIENYSGYPKDIVYGAAFIHDIGKW